MARKTRDTGARERIVETAAVVIAEEGVEGATMRGIAARAGVSTGFITHYFEDKSQLVLETLRWANATADRRVRDAAAGAGTDALDRLQAAVEAVLPVDATRRLEWQLWAALWVHAASEPRLAEAYKAGWRGLRAILAELIDEAIAEGALDEGVDRDSEAERLVTMLAGLGLLAGVETPARAGAAARRMLADELASLRARRSRRSRSPAVGRGRGRSSDEPR
jgi:AcrR family transcriptional regulator